METGARVSASVLMCREFARSPHVYVGLSLTESKNICWREILCV